MLTKSRTVCSNKKAYYDYFVEEKFEAGIELYGTEVKSIRQGRVNLKESYVTCRTGEAMLIGMHISPYENGGLFNKDPLRVRRLLMHRREINRLMRESQQKGYALVPLSLYFKGSKVKLEIGLSRGKKNYDKRKVAAEFEAKRNMQRVIKERTMY